ncbi:MAG: class I SAM-dependent methyltransferase [Pseudomonadota bacterium]
MTERSWPDPPCPVCRSVDVRHLMQLAGQVYWRCDRCEATFLDPVHHPDAATERAQYMLHENDVDDPRYRRFLSKLADPLAERLPPAGRGLDYGCGPGPALAAMLEQAGHSVALFDPFFFPDRAVLTGSYDFITCTEAAEHFFAPATEFERLNELLRPGGWLGVMTCFQTDDAKFATWHYRRDPTHVVFYRVKTFDVVARQNGWQMVCPAKDVALFQKPLGD